MWEAGEEGFSGWYEEPERRDEGYREKSQPKMCIRWERDLYSWNNQPLPPLNRRLLNPLLRLLERGNSMHLPASYFHSISIHFPALSFTEYKIYVPTKIASFSCT
ncbi:hypothetical protein NC653_031020 [Populus alba x Populus x berolinensis]|uniref:Uncharacterized protein n=1 Tax=Populus alba x Populus x berolinensis TaxID=444605 RepID=A0AAD6Q137_9ROSI|nr:hypothetical protein NC653_030120 [Populus alba x Populus x berolinensis]KAJ6975051.1 hypothetical protein NC653_031020 [Populus alba x Populus x berolinensis]